MQQFSIMSFMLLLIASATLEKLQNLPTKFWINVGIFLGVIIAAVVIWRFIHQMNKIWLSVIIFLICAIIGFNWIYERNEPEFMTPVIEPLAEFFPSKGAYHTTQQQEPGTSKTKTKPKDKPKEKTAPQR